MPLSTTFILVLSRSFLTKSQVRLDDWVLRSFVRSMPLYIERRAWRRLAPSCRRELLLELLTLPALIQGRRLESSFLVGHLLLRRLNLLFWFLFFRLFLGGFFNTSFGGSLMYSPVSGFRPWAANSLATSYLWAFELERAEAAAGEALRLAEMEALGVRLREAVGEAEAEAHWEGEALALGQGEGVGEGVAEADAAGAAAETAAGREPAAPPQGQAPACAIHAWRGGSQARAQAPLPHRPHPGAPIRVRV